MRYGFLGLGMILFGMVTLVIIIMFESITLDNDSEYYVLKEAMKASMLESIDYSFHDQETNNVICKTKSGKVMEVGATKIIEQKFVENFIRRFSASISGDVDNYTLEFYDIMELPPKATVKVISNNKSYKNAMDDITIVNNLTGILEDGCYNK